jgi:hypothetical protein
MPIPTTLYIVLSREHQPEIVKKRETIEGERREAVAHFIRMKVTSQQQEFFLNSFSIPVRSWVLFGVESE